MENQITGLQAGQPESVSENPTLTSQDSQNDASPKFDKHKPYLRKSNIGNPYQYKIGRAHV